MIFGEPLRLLPSLAVVLVVLGVWTIAVESNSVRVLRLALTRASGNQVVNQALVGDTSVPQNATSVGPTSASVLAVTTGLFAALTFSLGDITKQVAMEVQPDPLLAMAVGAPVGLVLYALYLIANGGLNKLRLSVRSGSRDYAAAGLASGLGQLAFFAAVTFMPVAYAAAIGATAPMFTILFSRLILHSREDTSQLFWVGASFLVCGAFIISGTR